MNQLQGRKAIIAGSADGLARAAAVRVAREGAQVAFIGGDQALGDKLAKEIQAAGGKAQFIRADLGRAGEPERAVAEAAAALGGIDVVVNAIDAMTPWKAFTVKDDADFVRQINEGVLGATRIMRAAYDHLRKSDHARVVNVGSIYGATAYAHISDSVTRDWALQGLTRAVGVEWAKDNILVNYLGPGALDMPQFQVWRGRNPARVDHIVQGISLGRLGDPVEDFGGALMFYLSDEACFLVGHTVFADGGQHLNMPVFEPGMKL